MIIYSSRFVNPGEGRGEKFIFRQPRGLFYVASFDVSAVNEFDLGRIPTPERRATKVDVPPNISLDHASRGVMPSSWWRFQCVSFGAMFVVGEHQRHLAVGKLFHPGHDLAQLLRP